MTKSGRGRPEPARRAPESRRRREPGCRLRASRGRSAGWCDPGRPARRGLHPSRPAAASRAGARSPRPAASSRLPRRRAEARRGPTRRRRVRRQRARQRRRRPSSGACACEGRPCLILRLYGSQGLMAPNASPWNGAGKARVAAPRRAVEAGKSLQTWLTRWAPCGRDHDPGQEQLPMKMIKVPGIEASDESRSKTRRHQFRRGSAHAQGPCSRCFRRDPFGQRLDAPRGGVERLRGASPRRPGRPGLRRASLRSARDRTNCPWARVSASSSAIINPAIRNNRVSPSWPTDWETWRTWASNSFASSSRCALLPVLASDGVGLAVQFDPDLRHVLGPPRP